MTADPSAPLISSGCTMSSSKPKWQRRVSFDFESTIRQPQLGAFDLDVERHKRVHTHEAAFAQWALSQLPRLNTTRKQIKQSTTPQPGMTPTGSLLTRIGLTKHHITSLQVHVEPLSVVKASPSIWKMSAISTIQLRVQSHLDDLHLRRPPFRTKRADDTGQKAFKSAIEARAKQKQTSCCQWA